MNRRQSSLDDQRPANYSAQSLPPGYPQAMMWEQAKEQARLRKKARSLKVWGSVLILVGMLGVFFKLPVLFVGAPVGLALFVWGRFLE